MVLVEKDLIINHYEKRFRNVYQLSGKNSLKCVEVCLTEGKVKKYSLQLTTSPRCCQAVKVFIFEIYNKLISMLLGT